MEHRYWRAKLAARLRACHYAVQEESPIGGGKTVDILASKEGRRIAFEIETGKSDVAANVEKVDAAGIDKLYVVATSRLAERAVAAEVAASSAAGVLSVSAALRQSNW
ncbi:MAG: hypothetical protein FJ290_01525 [Planctomycetes bacterium]|nr:hypothetical protein [Planctomycetota bacterium]